MLERFGEGGDTGHHRSQLILDSNDGVDHGRRAARVVGRGQRSRHPATLRDRVRPGAGPRPGTVDPVPRLSRSWLAATATVAVAAVLATTPAPPAAAFDPRGIARMQACTPPTEDFVSLEAAPEVVGAIPLGAGMHRLWDLGVGWTHVNPAAGTFDWSVLDAEVAQVEESGSRPMLVLGLTPQWAAANPSTAVGAS